MSPEVSVIIPTFNRAHILQETLDSVLQQTFKNWECIIVDDGSTDHTTSLLKKYLKDKRFQYLHRPSSLTKGACTCRNIGIANARGSYLQFLDSDDLLAPNKLEIQLQELKQQIPGKIATCKWGGIKPMWKTPRVYDGMPSYQTINNVLALFTIFATRFTYLPVHSYLVPKSVVKKAGDWKVNLKINQDGEFFTRVLLNSTGTVFCEKTFVLYRTGSGNRTSNLRNTREGVKSYTESWDMINKVIAEKAGITDHIFVKLAKADLYYNLKTNHPEWMKENKAFLAGRTPLLIYNFLRLLSRIQDRIQVKQVPVTG
ncbi:glycosyltransferase family 2 protein [Zunongwangia sp. H14]|uniref:glycosyltransferase family 2 protein n=1 Tax=Zunongwangia sp. H14 TaxID=3240792 RepID=UPI00356B1FCF